MNQTKQIKPDWKSSEIWLTVVEWSLHFLIGSGFFRLFTTKIKTTAGAIAECRRS